MHRIAPFPPRMSTHRRPPPWLRMAVLIAAVWLICLPRSAQAVDALSGSGLQAGWQTRVGGADRSSSVELNPQRESLSLLGDYYFATAGIAPAPAWHGGFRATGGVFFGPRGGLGLAAPVAWLGVSTPNAARGFGLSLPEASRAPYASGESASVPYVGVGYSGLKTLRATGGGWAFSADLGLMAWQARSAVRLGQQPVSETLRELQLSPLLQVGVSYAF